MELFRGSTQDFIDVEAQRDLVRRLKISFFDHYRYEPGKSEQNSWTNSFHALATQIKHSRLLDQGLILEMQLPLTSRRLDCMITGRDESGDDHAVLVELKQWTDAVAAEEDKCVEVFWGSSLRTLQHPSYQAKYYADYLREYRSAFYEGNSVNLTACAWLHNFQFDPDSPLLDTQKFGDVLQEAPLFGATTPDEFSGFLRQRVGAAGGNEVLSRIVNSTFAPSKKLMQHTASVIEGHTSSYILLDEQRVAFEKIMLAARKASNRNGKRTVIIVQGGPGTGKSVIALNAMAELLKMGKNVQHATGSKAFTENLRKALGPRAGLQFRYFNSFAQADVGEIDVLICDESHRIRETSNSRYTPKAMRSDVTQVEELIASSKVSVFFIDDRQVVRPGETGSTSLLTAAARAFDAKIVTQELQAQFRCSGSDDYIEWVDVMLDLRNASVDIYNADQGFDFRIIDSAESLDDAIRERDRTGESARLVAGYCWPWSDPVDGRLVDDVRVGRFMRPWNAKPDARHLPRQVPKSNFWATDPRGIEQVGCVYTAQGFEFDYVGVIWGPDLIRRGDQWVGVRPASYDKPVKRARDDQFVALVKNTYRVLLTRGLKGCYVHFVDPETRDYVRSKTMRTI